MTVPSQTVSVAMATYNGERFLEEQLDSIASQTHRPCELVVRDDASSDGTVALLRAFASRAPFPVRLIGGAERLGYVRNFEATIAACTGDLVALSDQDDVWLPHKLERLTAALDARPDALLAFSDAALIGEGLEPLGQTMWEAVGLGPTVQRRIAAGGPRSPLLPGALVTGATVCFRASLVPLALPMALPYWHDAWLALVATLHGAVLPVPEALVLYRQHGGNALGAPRKAGRLRTVLRLDPLADARAADVAGGLAALAAQARGRFSLAPDVDAALVQAEAHNRFRAALQPYHLRLVSVLREVGSGRYHAHSRGLRTAARDLLRRSPLATP